MPGFKPRIRRIKRNHEKKYFFGDYISADFWQKLWINKITMKSFSILQYTRDSKKIFTAMPPFVSHCSFKMSWFLFLLLRICSPNVISDACARPTQKKCHQFKNVYYCHSCCCDCLVYFIFFILLLFKWK